MNYSEGIKFECQGTGNCCTSQGEPGYVYLTLEDRRRFAAHFRLSVEKFTTDYCQTTDGFLHLKQTNTCQFLVEKRCSVYKARPTQCRTWPFWPVHMNAKRWSELSEFCPGIGKGRVHSKEEIEENLKSAKAILIPA